MQQSRSFGWVTVLGFRRAAGATALALALAGGAACSRDPLPAGSVAVDSNDAVGSVGLALQLAPGITLASASYTVTGPGGFTKNGSFDISASSTLSTVIGGIPAGLGYSINVTALATDGTTSCAGSAGFDVVAHAITAVGVHLTCHESARTGGISVTGTVNVCPVIDGVSALPAEAIVGHPVALSVAAHDSDHGPSALAYHWTVSSGALDNADAASPTFTCLFPGAVTINVATSDGDPSPSCADSSSVTVTCSAAAPQTYAWVELGADGQTLARVITPEATCPPIAIDGHSASMSLRVAAGTNPLRPTGSAVEDSKPSQFPVTTCEATIPAGAHSAIVAGRSLPLPKAQPNRIVVLGDTGCRLKKGNPWQACSDPDQWPFQKIAEQAASTAPDLVLHVGDYQYRENACPADIAGCQGSPWGYGWDTWEADLFAPAQKLLAAAPWVMVRGNHEECARAGQGWYRFLDTLPYQETRSCNSAANDGVGNFNDPYAVPVGSDAQFIVFDSAKSTANVLDPTKPADAPLFNTYQAEMQKVAALAAKPGVASFFTNHHPILGLTPVAGGTPLGGQASLWSVLNATFPGGNYFPPGVKLVLHGHVHLFQAIDFSTNQPTTLLAGNGGDNLDANLPDPFPLGPASAGGVEPAPGAVIDRIAHSSTFGFLVMDRVGSSWSVTAYTRDGGVMTRCDLGGNYKPTCTNYGFVHSP